MLSISDNTLYYTLSTIAQAGAAAFAFLGAFVLFRLQSADSRIQSTALALASFVTREGALEKMQQLIAAHRYREVIERMSASQSVNKDTQINYDLLLSEVKAAEAIRISFRVQVIPTSALLACSVITLALVDQIKQVPWLAVASLVVILAWFCYTLVRMSNVLRDCLVE